MPHQRNQHPLPWRSRRLLNREPANREPLKHGLAQWGPA